MTTKRCFKCMCEKPFEAFYAHARMADGHLNKCKDCTKKDVALHRQLNLEKVRAYDRARASMPHRIALNVTKLIAYRKAHPKRVKANRAVSYAISIGKLIPMPCWVCGEKAMAHHPDYDRPLDVVWLCQPHHSQAHALVANEPSMKDQA